jgi:tRNA threonylcarbamoyladenosine biosynthesis protein TsaE
MFGADTRKEARIFAIMQLIEPPITPAYDSAVSSWKLVGLAETALLAARLAPLLRAGDVVALSGELGAGKTFFARAVIQALGGPEEVPSPTFTLVQTYDLAPVPVWHFDLYRLTKPEDAHELDIEDAFVDAISLIEWPERLGALLPADRLDVHLTFGAKEDERVVTLSGGPSWLERLKDLKP